MREVAATGTTADFGGQKIMMPEEILEKNVQESKSKFCIVTTHTHTHTYMCVCVCN